jgi:hypothetical protein
MRTPPVVIMDYSCAWGPARFAYVISQAAIAFPDAVPRAPDLVLYPKDLIGKVAEAVGLGGRFVSLPGNEHFNKEYGLRSDVEPATASLFTSEVSDICLREKKLVLEVSEGSLLVYWLETYIKPEDLESRVGTAVELAHLLSRQQ